MNIDGRECYIIVNAQQNHNKRYEKIFIQFLSGQENKQTSFLSDTHRDKILSYITIIEEEIPKLVYNINYKLWLDSIFSRFVEVK